MAKTIKERSVEYERAIGSQEYCYLDIEESYQAGANAVLEEIDALHRELFLATRNGDIDSPWKLIDLLKQKGLAVVTKVTPAGSCYVAEDYHHKYYARKGSEPYCHRRVKRF